jgi:hypothetical protein
MAAYYTFHMNVLQPVLKELQVLLKEKLAANVNTFA